jgi:hypothetical protein
LRILRYRTSNTVSPESREQSWNVTVVQNFEVSVGRDHKAHLNLQHPRFGSLLTRRDSPSPTLTAHVPSPRFTKFLQPRLHHDIPMLVGAQPSPATTQTQLQSTHGQALWHAAIWISSKSVAAAAHASSWLYCLSGCNELTFDLVKRFVAPDTLSGCCFTYHFPGDDRAVIPGKNVCRQTRVSTLCTR